MLLSKYLKYKLFFFKHNKVDKITIKKGLIISIGWNLGKKLKSIHLFDPFTSIPMNGTKTKVINEIQNKIIDTLNKSSSFKNENIINILIPKIIKLKCLIKKQYEFVSSLSEAISEVETNEKNNPKKNKINIKEKIYLSIFFHQS